MSEGYLLEPQEVGTGGVGKVYRISRKILGRSAALKTLDTLQPPSG